MTPLQTYLMKIIDQCDLPVKFQDFRSMAPQIASLPEKQVSKSLKSLCKGGHLSFDGETIDRP